jgi:hypothetical protein
MLDPATALAFSVFENRGVFALLLGSGVSRGAQIPTGWEITLDLVRRVALLEDAPDQPDWAAWHRERFGSEPHYSQLLDRLSSSPDERRAILHRYIEPTPDDLEDGRKIPTQAHHAIAKLVKDGFVRVIITTNFDRLLENALRQIGIEPTVVKSDDDLSGAIPLTHAQCFILKLHGDYLDIRIKNTEDELLAYSAPQNALLDRIIDEYGLIICGWSGDWDTALRAAITRAPSRRYPLFWASRGALSPLGEDLLKQRGGRLIPIQGADAFFGELQRRVDVQASSLRPNPLSTELLVTSAKKFLGRNEHRIALDELFGDQQRRLTGQRSDPTLGGDGQWSPQEFERRVSRFEAMSEPLGRLLGVAGRWGDGQEFRIAGEALREAYRVPGAGGLTVWLNLRTYPAVLLLYAYGLGLLRAERFDTLFEWFMYPLRVDRRTSEPAIHQLLLGAWDGGDNDIWKQYPGLDRRKTALSDHLHETISVWTQDYVFAPSEYTHEFELFETLGGLAFMTLRYTKAEISTALNAQGSQARNFVWTPVGRTSWHRESRDQIFSDLTSDELIVPLLKAGFARSDKEFLELALESMKRLMTRVEW